MTLKTGRGQHRKYLLHVFTEHGAYMAGNILNSPRAIMASKFIVRAFIQLRDLLATHMNIAKQLVELEQRVAGHDTQIITTTTDCSKRRPKSRIRSFRSVSRCSGSQSRPANKPSKNIRNRFFRGAPF